MPSFGAPNRMPTSVSRNKGFTRMPGNSVVLATDKERLKILSVSRTSIQLLLEAADNLAALPILGRVIRALHAQLQRRGPFNCALWPFFRCGHKIHTKWLNFRFQTVRDELAKHFC